ncbi:MAG: hypothetical protein Q4F18_11895 [Clostridia bacterium]|nr:hypothetical protein [Clostridia bacterium]
MKLGAGRAEIRFPAGFFPTEGFSKLIHPLHVRAALIGESPIVLLSVEMTSLPDDETASLRALCAQEAQTAIENTWVVVTHTFSAPHFMPDFLLKTDEERARKAQLREAVHAAAREAIAGAKASAGDSVLGAAQGESGVAASRDIELEEGWWVGCGGQGPVDRTLTVVRAQAEGRTKALILHLAVQSSVLDGLELSCGGKAVSGDLAGIACAALEEKYPGAVVIFLVGAAGDAAPIRKAKGYAPDERGGYSMIDLGDAGIALAERLGAQLAGEAERLIENGGFEAIEGTASVRTRTFAAPAKKMNRNLHELAPCRRTVYEPDGEKEQTIELLALGGFAILGVRPELTAVSAQRIADASPAQHTLVATMVNGGAKYMADLSAYERCMYEAQNSPFAPGAAELLEAQARELLSIMG